MAQPALADARIACPLCHAPVHPIAGRCKHCKADLLRMRGGSTGAGETPVAIPVLGPGGAPAAAPMPLPGSRNGGAMPALAAVPAGAVEPAAVGPYPALPAAPGHAALPGPAPRLALPSAVAPVGRAPSAHPPEPTAWPRTRRWSDRWPLLVAIVAALAIIASLVVLLLNEPKKAKHLRALGPAPERMDTDTGPPPPPSPTPHAPAPTPPPPAGPQGSLPAPTAPTPSAPSDPVDPFDPPTAGGGTADPAPHAPGAIPRVADPGEFLGAAIDLGCERVLACTSSSADAQALCSQARSMRDSAATALGLSCTHFDAASAQSCLGAIARIPCPGTTDPSQLASLLMGVPACARVCGP